MGFDNNEVPHQLVWDLISIQKYALFFKAMHHNLTQPYNIRQIKFKEEVK